jgi:hypothetical protein
LIKQFQKSLMQDEKIDKVEVWSAIGYLDPDEREKDRTSIASFAGSDSSTKMFMQTIKDKEAACPKLGLSRVVRAGSAALSQRLPSRPRPSPAPHNER